MRVRGTPAAVHVGSLEGKHPPLPATRIIRIRTAALAIGVPRTVAYLSFRLPAGWPAISHSFGETS
jgi:hypothetical protein